MKMYWYPFAYGCNSFIIGESSPVHLKPLYRCAKMVLYPPKILLIVYITVYVFPCIVCGKDISHIKDNTFYHMTLHFYLTRISDFTPKYPHIKRGYAHFQSKSLFRCCPFRSGKCEILREKHLKRLNRCQIITVCEL